MASNLPDYVASARPVPQASRVPWYASTAPTYAGIMLWFVFWHEVPMGSTLAQGKPFAEFAGGTLSHGLGIAFIGLILAALICHFLFYVVPGTLGLKTGLPLYIVGTSTYGVQGGFLMPGFLMGVLQFGWLGVNAFFAGILLCAPFGYGPLTVPHAVVCTVWAVAAAFMGLKGIQYVAKVASFLPLVPLTILVVLFFSTVGGVAKFDYKALTSAGQKFTVEKSEQEIQAEAEKDKIAPADVPKTQELTAKEPLTKWGVIALLCTYIVGFFATAGAAGADFGMNNRDENDVKWGGLVGIFGATVFAGGFALLIVAGAHGAGMVKGPVMQASALMGNVESVLGEGTAAVFWYLLAIAAFPPACFSSFIAANSFKTTLPKVNPFVSCGIGTAVACLLAVTGLAGNAAGVFKIIGASFGPVCGAMAADYLLAGRQWAGPRAGFNLAGWISWVAGFVVGAADFIPGLAGTIPCPPVAAFIVGFVLYVVLAKAGLESEKLPMPAAEKTGG
jgi:cytosine permease